MQISHPLVGPSFPVQWKRPTSTPRLSILPVELAKDHLLKTFKQSKSHTKKKAPCSSFPINTSTLAGA